MVRGRCSGGVGEGGRGEETTAQEPAACAGLDAGSSHAEGAELTAAACQRATGDGLGSGEGGYGRC